MPPGLTPLEAANRSWRVHQMRLSEYFISNFRLRVVVAAAAAVAAADVAVAAATVVVVVRNFGSV